MTGNTKVHFGSKYMLFLYDFLIFSAVDILLFIIYQGAGNLSVSGALLQSLLAFAVIFSCRHFNKIYSQIWRYGGIQCYIKLLIADAEAFFLYFFLERLLPVEHIAFVRLLAFCCMNTLAALTIRMVYRYAYKYGAQENPRGRLFRWMLKTFSANRVQITTDSRSQKIRVAIVGAGKIGVDLAEDLLNNKRAEYVPEYFIDENPDKIGRVIHELKVLKESDATLDQLKEQDIQEVIFAVPDMESSKKFERYEYYRNAGFAVKVYDYPVVASQGQKRYLRKFSIEDLLMRTPKQIVNEKTKEYYKGKVILITGGGGSIGSELCRQLSKMEPKQLIVFDIYENCAYELQQSILLAYKGQIDIRIEIGSIRDRKALRRCFEKYHPDICIHAAAHKHVPLMENNCIEAIENNVFGCLNTVRCCEEYNCGRFLLVSTDKAVNPTSIMGATKRLCELIVQAYSRSGSVVYSATRFGNVLGSAGSVIPLFERQIAAGGPVTVTDKRIIRYFMTIAEASQLVLESGSIASNGDLFALDMGRPVKILDLAKRMIELSGAADIEILETGLRPGEKLYEELLINRDKQKKTDNDMLFIEHEEPITMEALEGKLSGLKQACDENSDERVREIMKEILPDFQTPEEANRKR